jgi:hypothetical protein
MSAASSIGIFVSLRVAQDFPRTLSAHGREMIITDGKDTGGQMLPADFIGHVDWSAMTKLAPSAFVDELAIFYRCGRVQRADLVGRTLCRR